MKSLNRCLSLLLVLLIALSSFAFAENEQLEQTDPYVIHHYVYGENGYTGPTYQYFSPYVANYLLNGQAGRIQHYIYSLYNTLTGETIPGYCTDITTPSRDFAYRQINLEDSTYAASAADQLRAIVLNGFYVENIIGESTDSHAARVAQELLELGNAAGVEGLTVGEAVAATQAAVWRAAHGVGMEFTDFVRTYPYMDKMPHLTQYYDLCNEERTNGHFKTKNVGGMPALEPESEVFLEERISKVYDYLLSLEPVAPTNTVVSSASFKKTTGAIPTNNGDGTFDLLVNATVDVTMAAGDNLTLYAVLDNANYTSAALADGEQTISLTLEDVPADLVGAEVKLVIDGMQTVSGVHLYEAKGGRGESQSMIGMNRSRMPVHAEVVATHDRVLNFIKTTSPEAGLIPLEGIIFDIYLVATMEDLKNGTVQLPAEEEFVYPEKPDFTLTTDANGFASVNLTLHGSPDGVYMVVERNHAAIVKPVDPFYVFVPMTSEDGSTPEYEITIQPKNDVKGNVRIEKDVDSIGNDELSVNAHENHTWIISASIPEDIASGNSYEISDTLDSRLDYIGNLRAQIESADGTEILAELEIETDYVLTVNDVDSTAEEKLSDSFTLALTDAGRSKLALTVGQNDFDAYMLRVYFDAQINANANMAEQIPNQTTLKYVNAINFDFEAESDVPVVYTGGAKLIKVDSKNHSHTLSGAQFELYRKATEAEVLANEGLKFLEGIPAPVVQVSFFDNADLTGEKITSAVSYTDGTFGFYGLAYGEYYLVETKAPDGYNLLAAPVTVKIDATSHTDESVVVIENLSGSILPETGGIGTTIFTVFGILLMCASLVFLVSKKRMN